MSPRTAGPIVRAARQRRHALIGRVFAAALASLALGACVLPADVPPPKSMAPATYRADSATSKEAAAAAWPAPGWWREFGSPELDRLIAQAESANLDIAAAVARIQQADAQIRVSGAPLFPSLSGQVSSQEDYQGGGSGQQSISIPTANGSTSSFVTGGSSKRHSDQVGLNASYELDFWGKNRAALGSARQSDFASRFDAATVALGIDASVANTYFTIVSLQARLRIAEQNLGVARDLLKALTATLQVGIGTALDVSQQQTQVATQLATIPPLRQQLEQNINALAILLGEAPADIDLNVVRLADLKVPSVNAGLPSTLLVRRPDIAQARAQLKASRFDVSVAKANLFPTFDLSAQGGWQSTAFNGLFNPLNEFYSLAANVTQPIFEGGQLRGQLALQRGRYLELLADYQKSMISAFEDVDNGLSDIRQTTSQEKLQRQVVALAQRSLDISRARLREGITDVTTVLNVEQTLFTARDNLAQTRLARLNATVSLYQALGGGWDEEAAKKSAAYADMPLF